MFINNNLCSTLRNFLKMHSDENGAFGVFNSIFFDDGGKDNLD